MKITKKESHDFSSKTAGRKGKWDWNALLNGEIHQVTLGDKGDAKPSSLATSIREQAANRGLGVKVEVKDDTVIFQSVTLSPEEAEAVKAKRKASLAKWAEASKAKKKGATTEKESTPLDQEENTPPTEEGKSEVQQENAPLEGQTEEQAEASEDNGQAVDASTGETRPLTRKERKAAKAQR